MFKLLKLLCFSNKILTQETEFKMETRKQTAHVSILWAPKLMDVLGEHAKTSVLQSQF